MATTRRTLSTPSVIVLSEEAMVSFMEEVQKGFSQINDRLDALEERITKPGLDTARLRKEIANAALKAAVTRPAVKRTPRSA